MVANQLLKRYLTLQEAVDDVLQSAENVEEYVVILPPAQGDSYAMM